MDIVENEVIVGGCSYKKNWTEGRERKRVNGRLAFAVPTRTPHRLLVARKHVPDAE